LGIGLILATFIDVAMDGFISMHRVKTTGFSRLALALLF
jgi:hypothetical protein